jgi:ribosome-interacting GTPase 1
MCPLLTPNCLVAKTSDLILLVLDATKSVEQRRLLEAELDAVGIRLNKSKPDGWYTLTHFLR